MSPRGRTLKTPAVVLRRSNLGEADRLLTLFTPELGKVRAVARGVRKPTSKSAGHVELYSVVDVMLAKGRSDLYVVAQAELLEPFLPLQSDLHRVGYASLFAELIDRFAVDEQANPEAYQLLVDGLGWLCAPEADLRLASRYYEMHLLDTMGYAPSLFFCAKGGDKLDAIDQFYSIIEGGVVCPDHAAGYVNMMPLHLSVFKILRHMMRSSWPNFKVLKITEQQHQDLQTILHHTLFYLLEQRLQSVDFLRRITRRLEQLEAGQASPEDVPPGDS